MTPAVLRGIFLFLLLNFQNLPAGNTQPPVKPDFKPISKQGLATYPLFRGDEAYYHAFGAELFSDDGRLFIFLERYEDSLTVIKIWDTLTGELKYQTVAPKGFPLYYDQSFHMQLSPDGTMRGFGRDNHLFMIGDENYQHSYDDGIALCQAGTRQPIVHLRSEQVIKWWGEHLRVWHRAGICA